MYNMVNTDIICPACGEGHLIREEPKVIKSNTETYTYLCPECGFVKVAASDEAMREYVKNQDSPICYLEAPQKCLDEKCAQADVFKDKLFCTATSKWYDITPNTATNSGGNYSGIASVPEDIVNHPSHYETGKFECIDVMRETQGDEAVQDFCICNALKYIYRHRNKNGVEDIRKAKWYIDKYLEIEEEKTHESK